MQQSLKDKVEALKTLLPLMWVYLSSMDIARVVRSYGQSEVIPPEPPPGWSVYDCDGRCDGCQWEKECGGEWWEFAMHQLERKYRLMTIAGAFARLHAIAPQMADAVRYTYMDERDPTLLVIERNPNRAKWAEGGVRWMARKIRCDLTPYYEKPRTTTQRIQDCLEEGITSSFTIACRVGVTVRRVQQVRRELGCRRLEAPGVSS